MSYHLCLSYAIAKKLKGNIKTPMPVYNPCVHVHNIPNARVYCTVSVDTQCAGMHLFCFVFAIQQCATAWVSSFITHKTFPTRKKKKKTKEKLLYVVYDIVVVVLTCCRHPNEACGHMTCSRYSGVGRSKQQQKRDGRKPTTSRKSNPQTNQNAIRRK